MLHQRITVSFSQESGHNSSDISKQPRAAGCASGFMKQRNKYHANAGLARTRQTILGMPLAKPDDNRYIGVMLDGKCAKGDTVMSTIKQNNYPQQRRIILSGFVPLLLKAHSGHEY